VFGLSGVGAPVVAFDRSVGPRGDSPRIASLAPVFESRPQTVLTADCGVHRHALPVGHPLRRGSVAANHVGRALERVREGVSGGPSEDSGSRPVVLHESVGERAILPPPVAVLVVFLVPSYAHLRRPLDLVPVRGEAVGAVPRAAGHQILVEAVHRVDGLAGERDVAPVEVRHFPAVDGPALLGLGGHARADRPVDRAGDRVGVGERRPNALGPRRLDSLVLTDQRDGVTAGGRDAGVARDVEFPVRDLE